MHYLVWLLMIRHSNDASANIYYVLFLAAPHQNTPLSLPTYLCGLLFYFLRPLLLQFIECGIFFYRFP